MIALIKDQNCNAVVTTADGQEVAVNASRLYDLGLARWKDWQCSAGKDMIFVDHDFTVYSGQCRNDCLGNLFDQDFKLFDDFSVCKRDECTPCETDLFTKKQHPGFDQ
jgi:hypothetical protein